MTSSLTRHGIRRDDKHLCAEFALCRKRIVFVRPKSIGWFHSKRAQVWGFVDSLDFMVVLFHVIWLPHRFWSTNSIVAGLWHRPTLCGVRTVLVVIDVGIGYISVGVIVVVLFDVGIRVARSSGSSCSGSVR